MAMKESAPSPDLLCSLAGLQDKGGSAAPRGGEEPGSRDIGLGGLFPAAAW